MAMFRRSRPAPDSSGDHDVMVGFGRKTGWLAIEGWAPTDVAALLSVTGTRTAGWAEGIHASQQPNTVAVTPVLPASSGAWVLVTGEVLLANPPDVAGWSEVSAAEVQFFASHRVTDVARWRRAVDGELVRAFAWVGERGVVLECAGAPGPAETAAGVPGPDLVGEELVDAVLRAGVDEQTVLAVAAEWSVDPSSLDGQPATGSLLVGVYR